ncbi:uncharacterized protein TNCV_1818051 [Trichonephila clavipes]|nr:uncharacterized protein TNCV_1818051 [Trichonephila clavipes]
MARGPTLKDTLMLRLWLRPSFPSWVSLLWNSCNSQPTGAGSLSPRSSKLLATTWCSRSVISTGYHPQANGMIEEIAPPIEKCNQKCHATERWTEVLPICIPTSLRAIFKEDILCTPAELVGTTIRLPGEMFVFQARR